MRPTMSAVAVLLMAFFLNTFSATPAEKIKAGETIKILHMMSFHSPWVWTDQQFNGFKDVLKDVKVEYKVMQMDAKKNNDAAQEKIGKEAMALIESWKPDLVYTSDDAALKYVTKNYINSTIPFVFSGVNKSPEFYGFNGCKNIIGVLEHEHYVPTVKLLQKMIPKLKKIAIFSDDDEANASDIFKRINEKSPKELPGISIEGVYKFKTFAEYKAKVAELNASKAVDAIVIVMWFKFKDEKGNNVDQTEVAKWTAENSLIPEASFWLDRVIKGNFCSVTVSGTEQGAAAGVLARAILVDGKAPSSFQFLPTMKGQPVINLARAKKLSIRVPSEILLMAESYKQYEWDK